MAESRKKLKTSNLFSSFIVSLNRNRSAVVCELLCNNSLFVSQLYKDKSLALRAPDLIFFTTDLQTVNYLKVDKFLSVCIWSLKFNIKCHIKLKQYKTLVFTSVIILICLIFSRNVRALAVPKSSSVDNVLITTRSVVFMVRISQKSRNVLFPVLFYSVLATLMK